MNQFFVSVAKSKTNPAPHIPKKTIPAKPGEKSNKRMQSDRSTVVRGFGIVGLCCVGFLALLDEPMVLGNPSFCFGLGLKSAEVVRSFVRPRDFHAPIAGL